MASMRQCDTIINLLLPKVKHKAFFKNNGVDKGQFDKHNSNFKTMYIRSIYQNPVVLIVY